MSCSRPCAARWPDFRRTTENFWARDGVDARMVLSVTLLSVTGIAISSRSVWTLTADADVIVVARVVDIRTQSFRLVEPGDTDAQLAIEVTLKGAPAASLLVGYSASRSCPPPPPFVAGGRVLAFLRRDAGGRYVTVAWNAVRPLEKLANPAQLLATVALAVSAQRGRTTIDHRRWALAAYAHVETRLDAVQELTEAPDLKPHPLSPSELLELEAAFSRAPSFDRALLGTLRIFNDVEAPWLTLAAVDVLDTLASQRSPPDWLPEAVDLVAARLEHRCHHLDTANRRRPVSFMGSRWAALKSHFKLHPFPRAVPAAEL